MSKTCKIDPESLVKRSAIVPLIFMVPVVPTPMAPHMVPYRQNIGTEWNALYSVPDWRKGDIPTFEEVQGGMLAPGEVVEGGDADMFKPRLKDVKVLREQDGKVQVLLTIFQLSHVKKETSDGSDGNQGQP